MMIVMMIIIYNRHIFIVQATGSKLSAFRVSAHFLPLINLVVTIFWGKKEKEKEPKMFSSVGE